MDAVPLSFSEIRIDWNGIECSKDFGRTTRGVLLEDSHGVWGATDTTGHCRARRGVSKYHWRKRSRKFEGERSGILCRDVNQGMVAA